MNETHPKWVEAGGEFQVPFMLAARRVLQGKPIRCPKCGHADLRFYFHAMKPALGQGTLWVWCPACRTKCHLPRVTPGEVPQVDPFGGLSLEEFAEIEVRGPGSFQDRLNRLWNEGVLTPSYKV